MGNPGRKENVPLGFLFIRLKQQQLFELCWKVPPENMALNTDCIFVTLENNIISLPLPHA